MANDDVAEKVVHLGLPPRPIRLRSATPNDRYFGTITSKSESRFTEICDRLLRPTDTALDIGANIGVTAAILSSFLPSGQVHAIEPAPRVFATLETTISDNNLSNVRAHQRAIGDKVGAIRFAENSAYGHVSETGSASVQIDTIDNFVAGLGAPRIDFMKIDVEGFEWHALRGASEVIKTDDPPIYFEFNS